MFTHPDIHYLLAKRHENELIDQASRYRLAATLTRGRHRRPLDLGVRVAATVRRVLVAVAATAPRAG